MDKLTAMSTFVKVVEARSFTRAAEGLNLPKARVSQRISDLEAHLGVRLLHRSTRALHLTEDGQAYFEKCQYLLQQVEELESTLKGGTAVPAGTLRIDSLVSIARWIVAPRLHDFQARYPKIQLRFGSSDRISHLLEEGLDCAIRGGVLKDSNLVARHLCDLELGLYAAPGYLSSIGSPESPTDLGGVRRLSWFSARERSPFAWELQSGAQTCLLEAGDGVLFDDPEVAMVACMAGSGICPGAPFAVEQLVRSGKLVPVLPDWHFPQRPVHLVYPTSKHLSVRVRCFVNWIVELFATDERIGLTPSGLALTMAPLPRSEPCPISETA